MQNGLPFPSPEDLPNPGIECWSPALQADSLPFEIERSHRRINQSQIAIKLPLSSEMFLQGFL